VGIVLSLVLFGCRVLGSVRLTRRTRLTLFVLPADIMSLEAETYAAAPDADIPATAGDKEPEPADSKGADSKT